MIERLPTYFRPGLAPRVEHTRLPLVARRQLARRVRVEPVAGRTVPVEEGAAGVALEPSLLASPRLLAPHPAAIIKRKYKVLGAHTQGGGVGGGVVLHVVAEVGGTHAVLHRSRSLFQHTI